MRAQTFEVTSWKEEVGIFCTSSELFVVNVLFCFVSFFFSYSSFSSGHEELIQTLTWDGTGSRLLSTDLVGVCKLWAMKVKNVNSNVVSHVQFENEISLFLDESGMYC